MALAGESGGLATGSSRQKRAHRMRCDHDLLIFREKWPTELSRKHCHGPAKKSTYLLHGSCGID